MRIPKGFDIEREKREQDGTEWVYTPPKKRWPLWVVALVVILIILFIVHEQF